MKKVMLPLLLFSLLISSCTPEPVPIAYGNDACHFCKMNIVDQQHAAELVTTKGKVFTFDAIECMINFKLENSTTGFAFQLVNDFNSPKALIDAEKSHFLISENLPSPMGANLNAFANKEAALSMQELKGGQVYNWKELMAFYHNKKASLSNLK